MASPVEDGLKKILAGGYFSAWRSAGRHLRARFVRPGNAGRPASQRRVSDDLAHLVKPPSWRGGDGVRAGPRADNGSPRPDPIPFAFDSSYIKPFV